MHCAACSWGKLTIYLLMTWFCTTFYCCNYIFFERCILSNIVYRLCLESTTYAYQPISIFNFWKLKEKINVLRKVETYITGTYEMGGQGGQLLTQPCFGISVNPISIRGGRLCPPPFLPITILAHPGHPSARDQNEWLLEQVGKKDLLK